MEQHNIEINGARLFYAECNPTQKEMIFFFHGNSSSHHTWEVQLKSPLLSNYRLIAFDLPAHGSSGAMPSGGERYTLPAIGRLMAAAVGKVADSRPYLLVGVSLGTNIVVEMLAHPLCPNALLLAGPCILGRDHTPEKVLKPGTKIGVGFIDEPTEKDVFAVIDLALNVVGGERTKQLYDDFRNVKDKFRSSMGQSVAEGRYSDQVALLRDGGIPAMIIFGNADKAVNPDYLDAAQLKLWKEMVFKLEHAGHWVHLDAPETFNMLLAEFAAEVFSKAGA